MKHSVRNPAPFLGLLVLLLLSPCSIAAGTPVQRTASHVHDSSFQVRAYELTDEQEASFSTADNLPSPFWSAWDSARGSLSLVLIDGVNNYAWGPPADSVGDGGLTVKLAYGISGVYILFEVQDNQWGGNPLDVDYVETVEFFGNKYSAQELYGQRRATLLPCLTAGASGGYAHQLGTDYFHLQIRFGGVELRDAFGMFHWNPLKYNISGNGCFPGNNGEGGVQYNRQVRFSVAETEYGIRVGILPVTARSRSEEWLIPWSQWDGPNGAPMTKRVAGQKLAACFGYNDKDFEPGSDYTAIRWHAADPYLDSPFITDSTRDTAWDAWGDIVFDIKLDDALARAGVRDIGARSSRVQSLPSPTVFFDIAGRTLRNGIGARSPRAGVFLATQAGSRPLRWVVTHE